MRRPGFALPSVLILVTAIGLFAAFLLLRGREDTARIAAAQETARLRAAVDGAIEAAAFALVNSRDRPQTPEDRRYETLIGDVTVLVEVQDADGLVDINAAPASLLRAALAAAGISPDRIGPLAARIVDFRDPDNLVTIGGAEDREYRAADWPGDAKDAPFDAVSELAQVLDFDAESLRAVAPFVTVHSGRTGIDPEQAPPALAAVLTGLQGQALDLSQSRRQIYRVRATGQEASSRFAAEATLRLSRDPARPVSWLDWRRLTGP